jgi:hypothetical protein
VKSRRLIVILSLALLLIGLTSIGSDAYDPSASTVDKFWVEINGIEYVGEDAGDGTTLIIVPDGANLSALPVQLSFPEGATAKPESGSPQDFSNKKMVIYQVTSANQQYIGQYSVRVKEESTDESNPPPTAGIDLETRKQAIIARYGSAKRSYFGAVYDITPSVRNPYSIGKVTDGYLADGLKMFNFYRFLAGIPDDVTLDEGLIYRAQHGAVLLAASGVFAHEPPKPTDMSQEFYEEGFASTTSSNISYWSGTNYASTTIDSALTGQMDDEDTGNIDRVGHRRWILSYQLKKTAFGVADIRDSRYFTVQAFDYSRTEINYPDYTLWPNETAFPSFVFNLNSSNF